MAETSKLITVKEAAALFDKHTTFIHKIAKRHKDQTSEVKNKRGRMVCAFTEEEMKTWIKKHEQAIHRKQVRVVRLTIMHIAAAEHGRNI